MGITSFILAPAIAGRRENSDQDWTSQDLARYPDSRHGPYNPLPSEPDISPLWAFAEAELGKQGQAPTHSDLEWLRQQIIVNALAPDSWSQLEPHPY